MNIPLSAQAYLTIGAGGLSFLVVVSTFAYFIKTLQPILAKIQADNIVHAEIIRNNTDAIKEVSRSNNNVAKALEILQTTYSEIHYSMLEHNELSTRMNQELIRISERTYKCTKK
jgi:D-ribose pyranose/furanose isomerase RbsD